MSKRLSMADIAKLLGVSRPRAWQLRKTDPAFPTPAVQEGNKDYFTEASILRYAAQAGRGIEKSAPVFFRRPGPDASSEFSRVVTSRGHAVLIWEVPGAFTFGLTYTPFGSSPDLTGGSLRRILADVPELDSIVIGLELFDVDGPELKAVDRHATDRVYEPQWTDLAEILAGPVPWWPLALRKPEEMLGWQPGAAQMMTSPIDEVDVGVLLRAVADHEAGSPVSVTLTAFAREQRQLSRAEVERDIDRLSETEAYRLGHIQIAAVAAAGDDTVTEVPEVVRRAAWAQILGNPDTLSWSCVREKVKWDGGKDFPCSYVDGFAPDADDAAAAEWLAGLEPAQEPLPAMFAVFDADRVENYLVDPRTDAPVVRYKYDAGIAAAIPARIPATAPLQELILGQTLWIRTTDGELYPVPRQHGRGVAYGYGGGGPTTLARTIALLLDDINAESASGTEELNEGLRQLVSMKWPRGTALTRRQLEAERAT
ncbi:hypothetical protein ACFV9C_41760 [Kribbella sp. NPDC059898]|uniref:hypothetical protein n=1 Tax=Kribbella sp. NPDC059898 TaxID=3346995 RepID=UPI00366523FF